MKQEKRLLKLLIVVLMLLSCEKNEEPKTTTNFTVELTNDAKMAIVGQQFILLESYINISLGTSYRELDTIEITELNTEEYSFKHSEEPLSFSKLEYLPKSGDSIGCMIPSEMNLRKGFKNTLKFQYICE